MRLACLELRQVWLIFRVLRQVNLFYLAPVRRTKVPARLCSLSNGCYCALAKLPFINL